MNISECLKGTTRKEFRVQCYHIESYEASFTSFWTDLDIKRFKLFGLSLK